MAENEPDSSLPPLEPPRSDGGRAAAQEPAPSGPPPRLVASAQPAHHAATDPVPMDYHEPRSTSSLAAPEDAQQVRRWPLLLAVFAAAAVVTASAALVVLVPKRGADEASSGPVTVSEGVNGESTEDDAVAESTEVEDEPTIEEVEAEAEATTSTSAVTLPPTSSTTTAELSIAPAPSETAGGERSFDLGLSTPISTERCDGDIVIFVGAAVDPASYGARINELLNNNPGSKYMRTASTGCSSLRWQYDNGADIYAVYYGPIYSFAAACSLLLNDAPRDAYAKVLDNATDQSYYWTRSEC